MNGSVYAIVFERKKFMGIRFSCFQNGIPIASAAFYASITMEKLKEVFKSDSTTEMPLVEDRIKNLHEAGKVLNEVIKHLLNKPNS
jgi:hypothetical protein